jgi:hypothetical protein
MTDPFIASYAITFHERRPWRPPEQAQHDLAHIVSLRIAVMLNAAHITTSKPYVSFPKVAEQNVIDALVDALGKAYSLGIQYGAVMARKASEGLIRAAKDILSKAKDIVSGIIDRITDLVASAIDAMSGDDDVEDVVQEVLDRVGEYLPDGVAGDAIHAAVEDGVMSALEDAQVAQVQVICSPGACSLCRDNEDASPINLGDAFPSGDTSAPFHSGCRCVVVAAS